MYRYSIEGKNKTVIKLKKSPNKLQIDKYFIAEKSLQKKRESRLINFNDDSFEKDEVNNFTDNKGVLNLRKKFKDVYISEAEENKKNRKKITSNIISSQKLKKELRKNRNKNTVMVKHTDMNTILNIALREKKKKEKKDKEKDKNKEKYKNTIEETEKFKEKDNEENEKNNANKEDSKKKHKEKDEYKEDNNNYNLTPIIRRKNKSTTKKQPKISFLLNKANYVSKRNPQKLFFNSNNNNDNKDSTKKTSNNEDSFQNEEKKKSNKIRIKNNKNLKTSECDNELEKSSKSKKSKIKTIKFQSVIFPKKNNKFSLNKKNSSNSLIRKKEDSESGALYEEKSIKNSLVSFSLGRMSIKSKHKSHKTLNNIDFYKDNNKNDDNSNSKNSLIINNEKNKLKDNKNYKNAKNHFSNISKYKIRHVNDIFVNRTKMQRFSFVQPEKLICFEYRKTNGKLNSSKNFMHKKSEDTLNDNNIKDKNNNGNNEKRRNKSFFCCL